MYIFIYCFYVKIFHDKKSVKKSITNKLKSLLLRNSSKEYLPPFTLQNNKQGIKKKRHKHKKDKTADKSCWKGGKQWPRGRENLRSRLIHPAKTAMVQEWHIKDFRAPESLVSSQICGQPLPNMDGNRRFILCKDWITQTVGFQATGMAEKWSTY